MNLISKAETTKGDSHLLTQIPEKDKEMFFFFPSFLTILHPIPHPPYFPRGWNKS